MTRMLRCLAILIALATGAAAGAQERRMTASYDVFTGGFRVVEMDVDLSLDPAGYGIEARLRTRGLFATLFPWEQVNRVRGVRATGAAFPLRFEQRGSFRSQDRHADIAYRDGRIDSIKVHPTGSEDGDRDPVDPLDAAGALDPLTGIVLLMLRIEAGGDCSGSYEGFDGRRRFQVELADAGSEPLQLARAGGRVDEALARVCDFVYRQTGGFARRVSWGPDRQREPRPGRFWLTPVGPGGAVLPMRMEMENNWGRMIAHLRVPG